MSGTDTFAGQCPCPLSFWILDVKQCILFLKPFLLLVLGLLLFLLFLPLIIIFICITLGTPR